MNDRDTKRFCFWGKTGAAAAITLLLLLAGCAGTKSSVQETRDVKEVFSSGLHFYQKEMYEEAEKEFKSILEDFPLSPYALEAQIMLGDTYYKLERYEDAASYYTSFVAMHPSHPKAPYALFQKGMCHFKEVLSVDRDQTSTRKALFAFEDLVRAYPDSPYAEKAKELMGFLRERLAESEFYVGRFYYKTGNYKGALYRFREILENYPDAGIIDKTLYYMGKSYSMLGDKELARKTFTRLLNEFPDSPFANDVEDEL